MENSRIHTPVLKEEVLHFLNPKENENFIDCTAGSGGHALALLERNKPKGKVLAIEWDIDLYKILIKKKKERLIVINDSYTNLERIVEENDFHPVSGILFDLGFSSFHVDRSGRGFSFQKDELLDMRYNEKISLTAREIVNEYKEKDLLHIISTWGEERYVKEIVRGIILERREKSIETTKDLVRVIELSVPSSYKKKRIHCATKTFQALRIAVNGEIVGFKQGLLQALTVLPEGGKLAIITFHGIEEKTLLDFAKRNNVDFVTKKPIIPKEREVKKNIRSRSGKLRVLIKK